MSTSLALGITGTIIAVVGVIFKALERRDRRRAAADERRDRIEQIEFVRRQVATSERHAGLEEAAYQAARAADVRVRRGGRDSLGWSFDLVNTGPATATSVKAWIVRADTGDPVSVTLELAGPLLPGEPTTNRSLRVPLAEELIKERPPLALMLSWIDTDERQRRDEHPIDL